jgi:parallel beta-helix repeat protein
MSLKNTKLSFFQALLLFFYCDFVLAKVVYIDSNYKGIISTGSQQAPYSKWADFKLKSGTTYKVKKNSVFKETLFIGGLHDIAVISYGNGNDPVIDAEGRGEYGVKLLSTKDVHIKGLAVKNTKKACFFIIGSRRFLLEEFKCSNSWYGVQINNGKNLVSGVVSNGIVKNTRADGIGSWGINGGLKITGNTISEFGNDGIDILGSTGVEVSGNTVFQSVDSPIIGRRGSMHVGIKAGGNRGKGGGRNLIKNNTVYKVKNFGIFNRAAVGNSYIGNYCYENGVNFNFVNPERASMARVEGNISERATFIAGLNYDVFIPRPTDLEFADHNKWYNAKVNVKGVGVIDDIKKYKKAMAPYEQYTEFKVD